MDNKIIAITGAASGIGRETAKLLASKGAKVSLADTQAELLHKVIDDIKSTNGDVLGAVLDVRDSKKVEDWIRETVQSYGELDGAVNMAGEIGNSFGVKNVEDVADDDWDLVIGVNQKGVLNSLRAQIPHIKRGGSIVNASSIAGLRGFTAGAAYVASKHAVVGLTKVTAKELGPRNIRCNCICPGPVDTPLLHKIQAIMGNEVNLADGVELKRKGEAGEIAKLVEFLLSEDSSYITGTALPVDGGLLG